MISPNNACPIQFLYRGSATGLFRIFSFGTTTRRVYIIYPIAEVSGTWFNWVVLVGAALLSSSGFFPLTRRLINLFSKSNQKGAPSEMASAVIMNPIHFRGDEKV